MARIGISILGYNSRQNLPDCLSSLALSLKDFAPGEVEVMVWDNASKDDGAAWTRQNYPQFKVHASAENLGFAAGNNRVYEVLKPTEYFVLLNDDTIVDPDWLKELILMAEKDPKTMVVQSLIKLSPDKDKINSWGNNIHFLGYGYAGGNGVKVSDAGDQIKDGKVITYASGAAMLVKTKLLRETPLFDGHYFMYHEDLDLGWRVKLLGYQSVLAAKSVIYHKFKFSKSIAKYYYMERNRFFTIFQNYHALTLLLIMPAFAVMEAGSFGYSIMTGWYKEKLKAYSCFLNPAVWKMIWEKAYRVQKTRKVGDRQVVSDFVGDVSYQELQHPLLTYFANPILNFYWKVVKFLIFW